VKPRKWPDPVELRALAAGRGLTLVKGSGRVVGKQDHGRYGLEDARTGHKVMGFGNRGVTATLDEVERYLRGGEDWGASLRAGKKRKRPLSPWWERP
jgi:hypothetical protein